MIEKGTLNTTNFKIMYKLNQITLSEDVYNAILSDLEENSLKNEKMALKGVQQNERL